MTKKVNPNIKNKKGIFSGLTIAFAAAAIFLAVVGGTVAYLYTSTNSATNTFTPGIVKCEVVEDFNKNGAVDNIKKSITVKNTGNTPAYMRVCFTTYWVEEYTDDQDNPQERVVGKSATLPTFDLSASWVKGNDGYYYCTTAIPVGESTPDMIADGTTGMQLTVDGNFKQVVEVFAQAIQSAPDQAVIDAWGTEKGGAVNKVTSGALEIVVATQS